MKLRLFKAFLVFTLIIATAATAARAYFTSVAVATDNKISTGTLRLAIDSTDLDNPLPNYFNLVTDGSGTPVHFDTESGAKPGDTFSYWAAFRNAGSMPFTFDFDIDGEWPGLNPECSQTVEYMSYTRTPFDSCGDDVDCNKLQTGLIDAGFTLQSGQVLEKDEFAIYKIEMDLSVDIPNCYQGADYSFDLTGNATQILAP